MGEYAAIEKEAKLFTELCVHNDAIDPNLFDEFGVKRGLRDKDGNGVLAGITNISRIDAFEPPAMASCGTAGITCMT